MSKISKYSQEAYQDLAAQLGDLYFRKKKLEEDIERLLKLITHINDSKPMLAQLESKDNKDEE